MWLWERLASTSDKEAATTIVSAASASMTTSMSGFWVDDVPGKIKIGNHDMYKSEFAWYLDQAKKRDDETR